MVFEHNKPKSRITAHDDFIGRIRVAMKSRQNLKDHHLLDAETNHHARNTSHFEDPSSPSGHACNHPKRFQLSSSGPALLRGMGGLITDDSACI
jgi:hypothetical protein